MTESDGETDESGSTGTRDGETSARESSDESLVSVVIPTYYRYDALAEAIASALGQSHRPVQVVVVDDSGEGHAEPVATAFDGVEYVAFEENRGANAARTAGARRADGRYVQFLDDDDRLAPRKLERQLAVFDSAADDVGVVYSGVAKSNGAVDLPDADARGHVLQRALRFDMWPCMTSTMLLTREALVPLLPLSDRTAANDIELMIQLAERTAFDYVDEALVYKRLDDDSLGHSVSAAEARFDIIDDYAALYDAQPPAVRRAALANAHETMGAILLRQHPWSARAIRHFATAFGYSPSVVAATKVLASVLGKPGWQVARLTAGRL